MTNKNPTVIEQKKYQACLFLRENKKKYLHDSEGRLEWDTLFGTPGRHTWQTSKLSNNQKDNNRQIFLHWYTNEPASDIIVIDYIYNLYHYKTQTGIQQLLRRGIYLPHATSCIFFFNKGRKLIGGGKQKKTDHAKISQELWEGVVVGWFHVANECGFDKFKPMHLPALASLLTHTNKHTRKKNPSMSLLPVLAN